MDGSAPETGSSRYLSLRWKSLIALSLALILVNASLALIANAQFARQFELQQGYVRDQQARQLRALVDERNLEMSKLASLVPLLGTDEVVTPDLLERIAQALDSHSALLDLEWDIRSVHWLLADGTETLGWPENAAALPAALIEDLRHNPEQALAALYCDPDCRQYRATPLLVDGTFAGNLVLGRSVADALLTFQALTGAEVAMAWDDEQAAAHRAPTNDLVHPSFPAMTFPDQTLPVLQAAMPALTTNLGRQPMLVQHRNRWFEVFRVPSLAAGIDALVVNDVTAQRAAINAATLGSLLIGLLGLLLSGGLLLLIIKGPLYRLRDLATVVPLLAENRFEDLRNQLPQRHHYLKLGDEIDLMTETIGNLTDRMEELQTDRERAESRLVWLADHDPLTHLFNRRRFNKEFQRILDQARRFGHQGALLFIDLDQFKDVNDLSGHPIGDSLLQQVAAQLRLITETSDLLARLGGDEFALALPEATEADAVVSAESIQRAIRGISVQASNRRHQGSASIGICLFPTQGTEASQLMAYADLAMYQAKERGRGRWYLFSPHDLEQERLDARVLMRDQITRALQEDSFVLHAQPIIEIATGRVRYLETLLRMRGKTGEVASPSQFIPIAERDGLIHAIDRWVIDSALACLDREPDLRLSVNLSANALDDPSLLGFLQERLAGRGIAPERLMFELTETAAINSLAHAARLMQGMKALGCRFALDDFGSGYASYAYLRNLPVDVIKIDGAFIRDIATNPGDRILVKAITDMAHGLGKRVVAEFVENAAILEVLAELGVDDAQGYHLGKPQPFYPTQRVLNTVTG